MTKPSERPVGAIGALERLPLFLDLADRSVLLIGGSNALAWKFDLVQAAGARIAVIAPSPGPELRERLRRTPGAVLRQRDWQDEDLSGQALVIADADDEAEAERLARAAAHARVPCNVVDRPAHGDVTFGSIVNRSPVLVSISTGGAAPVLAQALRRRIETALPAHLGAWAARVRAWRPQIRRDIPLAGRRRALWRYLAERMLSGAPVPDEETIDTLVRAGDVSPAGRVTLVGAGPGDSELMTLKAVRALQNADVILFDALVSDDVLDLARREARRMLVGKRGGRPSCDQSEINALMIRLACQGKHVVRLKAGDPMIFGRAGEEIEALERAGLRVSVIPGITAASAAASALNVSLTRRGVASSLRFITGHSRHGVLPDDVDWPGLARGGESVMVYMAAGTAPALSERLCAAGMAADTPAVIAIAVGRPAERFIRCRLAELGRHLRHGETSPVLVGIGQVFETADARHGALHGKCGTADQAACAAPQIASRNPLVIG